MSSVKLFLLEITVIELNVIADATDQNNDGSPGQKICVSFKFLDLLPLEICESDFRNKSCDPKSGFKHGKSCMFALPVNSISELSDQDFKLKVSIFKRLEGDSEKIPDQSSIGETDVDLSDSVLAVTKSVLDAPDEVPVAKSLNTTVTFKNASGSETGQATVLIGLSCCGNQLISRFQQDCNKSFVVKSHGEETGYRCHEISSKEKNNGLNGVMDRHGPVIIQMGCKCRCSEQRTKLPFKSCECKSARPLFPQEASTAYPLRTHVPPTTFPEVRPLQPRIAGLEAKTLDATKMPTEGAEVFENGQRFDTDEYLALKKMPVDAGGVITRAKEIDGVPFMADNLITSENENISKDSGTYNLISKPDATSDLQLVPSTYSQRSPNVQVGLESNELGKSMILYSVNPSYNVNFTPDRAGNTMVRISPKTEAQAVWPITAAESGDDRYLLRLTSVSKTTGKKNTLELDLRTPRPRVPVTVSKDTQYSVQDFQTGGAADTDAADEGAKPAKGKPAKGKKGGKKK